MKFFIRYARKLAWLGYFIVYIILEIIISSFRIAFHVLMPVVALKPGVIAISLDGETDIEIMVLANLISLTPGTLSLDVSSDRGTLFIHTMFAHEADAIRHSIKRHLERPILEIMR